MDGTLPGLPGHGTEATPSSTNLDLITPFAPPAGGFPAERAAPSPTFASTLAMPRGGSEWHGMFPLVQPALSAVAAGAMMSRRDETPASQPSGPAQQAESKGGEDSKGPTIDLDALAGEMADRIARRLKRDKERRGFYG